MTLTAETDHYARVRADIAAASSFDWPFVVMNVLAAVVASYGLLLDSAAVVIGAMILAMLLGPISGVALALIGGDARLLRRASLAVIRRRADRSDDGGRYWASCTRMSRSRTRCWSERRPTSLN